MGLGNGNERTAARRALLGLAIASIASAAICAQSGVARAALPVSGTATVTGDDDSWVAENLSRVFDSSDSVIVAQDVNGNVKHDRFHIRAEDPVADNEFRWDFSSAFRESLDTGNTIRPGFYGGATRYPFNDRVPGLDVSGDGRGCNHSEGSFDIREIEFGPDHLPASLWVLYEQQCEDDHQGFVIGEVRLFSPAAAPPMLVTPGAAHWPVTSVGASSEETPVRVLNTGDAALTVADLRVEGLHAGDFTLDGTACDGEVLQPGESCEGGLSFEPTARGPRTARAVIETAAGYEQAIELDAVASGGGGDSTAPGPVAGLSVEQTGSTAEIEWQNPGDFDYSHTVVRWVPGTGKLPAPDRGRQGYAGTGTSVTLPGLTPGEPISVTAFAIDDAGNVSSWATYGPPESVTPSHSSPGTPANDNDPIIFGTAEPGSTVALYNTTTCTGSPVASGTAAEFGDGGFQVSVPDNSANYFRTKVTNALGTSECTVQPYYYREDSNPPFNPGFSKITPVGPANDNFPELGGNNLETNGKIVAYGQAGCTGPELATGNFIHWVADGLRVEVPDDSRTDFYVRAFDEAGNGSICEGPKTYIEESSPPGAPVISGFSTGSPANDNGPRIRGTSSGAETIKVHQGPLCSGPVLATGTPAEFAGAGIVLSVADNTSTVVSAEAVDLVGNLACSQTAPTYVEDSAAPMPPQLSGTRPGSPGHSLSPLVFGTAEPGSVVRLFAAAGCLGAPIASGDQGAFSGGGIAAPAAANASSQYYGDATDTAGNRSTCSPSGLAYTSDTVAPDTTVKKRAKKGKTSFSLGPGGAGASFLCAFDRKPLAPCAQTVRARKLRPGPHTFTAAARDAAGNVDATPAKLRFKVQK